MSMSTSPGITRVGKAHRAFENARDKIKEQMNSKEFTRLTKISSLDHVIQEAQRIGKELDAKATSGLANKISQIAFGIEPYARIMEGFCKLAPMGGDLIWGVVSFLLVTAGTNADVLGEVLDFFMGMAEEIQHLTLVEDTFTGSHIVISAVEAVYIAIIKFWARAIEYYMDKLKSDIVSRMKAWLASSTKMSNEFLKLKAKIATQKTRLHEVEATQHHVDERAERTRRQQKELSDFIAPSDYVRHFRAAKNYRHDGTCEWLRDKQEYRDWLEGQASDFLVIYGSPGVGKTILSAWLVDEARSRPAQHITLYHYFKETDDSCNSALAAARSLLHQFYLVLLSTSDPFHANIETELQTLKLQPSIDFESLWSVVSSLLTQYSQRRQSDASVAITLVLDAVDECKDSKGLVRSLRKLVHDSSSKIRVVVTARKSGDHVDEFRRTHPDQALPTILEVSQEDVKDDITAFITHSVNQIERLGEHKYHNLRNRIILAFSDIHNHQGMFLWAYLMCKEVERQEIAKMQKLLDHLPKGLNGMYARICKRLSANNDLSHEFTRHVLQWVVASRRPMTFAELEEALKLATANDGDSDAEFFDDDGGLLWSRRDIVRCCGDLVRYTGLAEGDTIAIVHLSASQFLTTHPSKLFPDPSEDLTAVIQPFFVDTRSAETRLGTLCLKYLLSTSLHSDGYFTPPLRDIPERTSYQDTFKERYPLIDYATVYWLEYALDGLPYPDPGHVNQLAVTIREFVNSVTSAIWLEELIRLTYVEYVQYTLRRFTRLSDNLVSTDGSRWSNLMLKALVDFTSTLKSAPHMVRLCFLHVKSVTDSPGMTDGRIQPLEIDRYRKWIHYDPDTDNLISATSYRPALKCQAMKTGLRFRPIPASEALSTDPTAYFVRFATTNTSADKIAVTYQNSQNDHSSYFTVCWNVSDTFALDNWATAVFVDPGDKIWAYGITFGKDDTVWAHGIAFGKDDTIITPNGIFSLERKQRIDRPRAIFDPDPILNITDTRLSGNGDWAARIRDFRTLEVLTILGTSTYQQKFKDSCSLLGFSDTGNKAVIVVTGKSGGIFCILVKEAKQIDMSTSFGYPYTEGPRFTRDEERFVAVLDRKIAVWKLSQDENGSYPDHADVIYIFDYTPGLSFDLVPGESDPTVEDALIVLGDGSINRRPLDLEWLPRSDTRTQTRWVVTWNSPVSELVTWIAKPKVLVVERWSLVLPQPALVSRIELPSPVATDDNIYIASPDGRYLATKTSIIDAYSTLNGSGVHEFDLPGEIESSVFNVVGTLFACVLKFHSGHTLCIFDGSLATLRASKSFTHESYYSPGSVTFSDYDPALLAFDKYVLRINGNGLVVECQIEKHILGFSKCGRYYYEGRDKIYELPRNLVAETSQPTEFRHPMRKPPIGGVYIYPPHEMQLKKRNTSVYLQRKAIYEKSYTCRRGISRITCRSRIVAILPDRWVDDEFTLLWPDEDVENVTLLVVSKRGPILIDTRITRAELMIEEEWLDDHWIEMGW